MELYEERSTGLRAKFPNSKLWNRLVTSPAIVPHQSTGREKVFRKHNTCNEPSDHCSLLPKQRFPKSVFFILGNEFCERFCQNGMRAVLTLYFTEMLFMTEDKATVMFHAFTMLCYFTPIFGAIIADGWLGKFKTILYLSVLYACGNILLSTAAITTLSINHGAMAAAGLVVIACGTGGIKPCVSAFGGDQFEENQDRQRKLFFSIFYFAINAGSVISSFVTPELRNDVSCFGNDTCYPLAFGVPAILMVVAILLFVIAKPMYKIIPPKGSILTEVCKCISHALTRKMKSSKAEKRKHWLDYADDRYDKKFLRELRAVLHVMLLYVPLPVFWALFDQQGSRWTLQATYMDGELNENFTLKPDQFQTINPLLILLFIPLFESCIYPLFAKCNLLEKALQRMMIGGLLAVVSFIIAGFLQLKIETNLPTNPSANMSEFSFVNSLPCPLNATFPSLNNKQMLLEPQGVGHLETNHSLQVLLHSDVCSNLLTAGGKTFEVEAVGGQAFTTIFMQTWENDIPSIKMAHIQQSREKPQQGRCSIRILYTTPKTILQSDPKIYLLSSKEEYSIPLQMQPDGAYWMSNFSLLDPGTYKVFLPNVINGSNERGSLVTNKTLTLRNGAVLTYVFSEDISYHVDISIGVEAAANTISMLWLLPQYIVITLGEILFSITGLEFSYSQAPASMTSVLTAAWLLTTAFGNLIVIIIAEITLIDKQSTEFFVFAALMLIVMIIFGIMSLSYEYVDPQTFKEVDFSDNKDLGLNNLGFEEEKRTMDTKDEQ